MATRGEKQYGGPAGVHERVGWILKFKYPSLFGHSECRWNEIEYYFDYLFNTLSNNVFSVKTATAHQNMKIKNTNQVVAFFMAFGEDNRDAFLRSLVMVQRYSLHADHNDDHNYSDHDEANDKEAGRSGLVGRVSLFEFETYIHLLIANVLWPFWAFIQ